MESYRLKLFKEQKVHKFISGTLNNESITKNMLITPISNTSKIDNLKCPYCNCDLKLDDSNINLLYCLKCGVEKPNLEVNYIPESLEKFKVNPNKNNTYFYIRGRNSRELHKTFKTICYPKKLKEKKKLDPLRPKRKYVRKKPYQKRVRKT